MICTRRYLRPSSRTLILSALGCLSRPSPSIPPHSNSLNPPAIYASLQSARLISRLQILPESRLLFPSRHASYSQMYSYLSHLVPGVEREDCSICFFPIVHQRQVVCRDALTRIGKLLDAHREDLAAWRPVSRNSSCSGEPVHKEMHRGTGFAKYWGLGNKRHCWLTGQS